ncbi:MAG TPA: SurA N-terminal domain-containing protein [Balneolaceae bacterium]|nr:SurA N-terminal domain-containing protein [Balneolaceae bacterium]
MRNSTSSILWILIFSFGILWVLADTQVFDAIALGPQSLGDVNGESISLEEYNNRVSFYTDRFNQQTNQAMTPEMRTLYENQAWEDLVAARLIRQKMNEMGITVTDNELIEMITGDNPDPFIRQQFGDEQGNIDRIALRAAIDAPENSQAWIQIEQQLRDNRRQQKMSNYIASGLKVNSLDIENEYIMQNSFAEIEYVRFPYSEVTNEDISVSEEELREYYENNQSNYERSETYRFQFVSWDKTPTPADTANTIEEVEELREQFATTDNDSLFMQRYQSATPYQGAFVSLDEMREDYREIIQDLEVGEVSEVVMINNAPHMLKKIEQNGDEVRFAVFSYQIVADPINTIDRLAEQANEFEFYASSDGFDTEAERRELDVQTATATKDVPFVPGIGQAPQLLNELENMSRGDISDAIELSDQFLVVRLIERTPAGTRPFTEVRNQVENSVQNEKRSEIMLDRVKQYTDDSTGLEQIAEASEREVQVAENVRYGGNTISGAGREVKVIGYVFGMEEGEVSGPVEGSNAVFVIRLVEKSMADPAAMTEAERNQIRTRLEQQKFQNFNQVFLERLKEEADITDNRSALIQ